MIHKAIPNFTERDAVRFWKCVQIGDGCWLWQGDPHGSNGYGRFYMRPKYYASHRCMWKLLHGDPGDLFVLHRCDVPLCVRPDHLFLGTLRDNTQDAIRKGRHKGWAISNVRRRGRPCPAKQGERHHGAKLTEQLVLEARRRHAAGESAERMCGEFGVNWRTLHDAIKGRAWKHLNI